MRLPTRRRDDADVIRARLRALLAESGSAPGWVPDDRSADDDGVNRPAPAGIEPPDTEPAPDDPGEAQSGAAALPGSIGRHRAPGTTVRLNPGRRGVWSLWAAGLLAAVAVVVWTWLDRPEVERVPAAPTVTAGAPATAPGAPGVGEAAQTSSTLVVSVVGQVLHPGLVTVPAGARVADAIDAAGGMLPGADAASVNLAAVVSDGEQVAVGVPGSAATLSAGAGGKAARINLNTATVADLDALPGIGPVLAQRIVDHRQQHGRFRSVDELNDVSGIGPALYARLADRVTV